MKEPKPGAIFTFAELSHLTVAGALAIHIHLVAATDMSFILKLPKPSAAREQALQDTCAILPALLRVDSELMALAGGDLTAEPSTLDLMNIQAYVAKYRDQICSSAVGMSVWDNNLPAEAKLY